jgi:hypothetical protein
MDIINAEEVYYSISRSSKEARIVEKARSHEYNGKSILMINIYHF